MEGNLSLSFEPCETAETDRKLKWVVAEAWALKRQLIGGKNVAKKIHRALSLAVSTHTPSK